MYIKPILYVFTFLIFSSQCLADGQKQYELFTISNKVLSLSVDVNKKLIIINSINVKTHISTGDLVHVSQIPYSIPLKNIKRISNTEVTYSGDDWYDGIGVKVEITLFSSDGINSYPESADVSLTSQFEEISLSINEQLLKVKIE